MKENRPIGINWYGCRVRLVTRHIGYWNGMFRLHSGYSVRRNQKKKNKCCWKNDQEESNSGSYFIHQNSRERMINFAVTHARDQTNASASGLAFVCIRNKEATSELSQVMTNFELHLKKTGTSTQNKTYSQKTISKNSKNRPSLLMPTMIPSVFSVASRVRASRSRGWPAGSSHALFVYKLKSSRSRFARVWPAHADPWPTFQNTFFLLIFCGFLFSSNSLYITFFLPSFFS